MIKVVLVIDHLERDLRGVVLVAWWLNIKWGIKPIITHTKNEISSLIKYKPDMILLQHVRHHWQKEFLEYAKAQNTAIGISLAEGFPIDKNMYIFQAGRDEYVKMVDLFLTWGPEFNQELKRNTLTKHAISIDVGSPRFDYHNNKYDSLTDKKNKINKKFNISKHKQIITWLTSTPYANPEEGYDKFIKKMKKPTTSDSRIDFLIEPLAKDNQKVFDIFSSFYMKLCEEFPKIHFLIKVHPGEKKEIYTGLFKGISNVTVIYGSDVSLTSILKYSDIIINWRCTTASESWLVDLNKKTIAFELDNPKTELFKYLIDGSDIIKDYEGLKDRITAYLNGNTVSPYLISKRRNFINKYMHSDDGKSSERCSDQIYNYINNQVNSPKRSLHNYKIIAKYLGKYKFNNNWLSSKRTKSHSKYIPPELVVNEFEKLNMLYGGNVDYLLEM